MMNNLQTMEQEKSVLRWGGLAGMLGAIFFILALVVVIVGPVGMEEPADLAQQITQFPDIQTARVLENLVYLTALILEVPLFLASYRALRRTSLAPALFGSVVGIVGLVAMMVSTTPHVAHSKLADLYHAPGVTLVDQVTLTYIWQAIWAVVDMTTYVGFFTVTLGLTLLAVGMLGSPSFGKSFGGVSLVLGVVGVGTAVLQLANPASMVGIVSYFAIITFCLVLGWKVYSVSRVL